VHYQIFYITLHYITTTASQHLVSACVQHVLSWSLAVYCWQLFTDLLRAWSATFQNIWRTNLRVSRPSLYIYTCRGMFYGAPCICVLV